MLIKELPVQIQELVFKKQIREGNSPTNEIDLIRNDLNFSWSSSGEGHSFWSQINGGDYTEFYKRYPKIELTEQMKAESEDLFAFFKS